MIFLTSRVDQDIYDDLVQLEIIDTPFKGTSFLSHEKDRSTLRQNTQFD